MIDVIITALVSFVVGVLTKAVHSRVIKSKCHTEQIDVEIEINNDQK